MIVREPDDGGNDLDLNPRRYQLFVARDMHQIADDLVEAARRANDALDRSREEPDLDKRRLLAKEVGFTVGALDRVMRLGSAAAPEHARAPMESQTRMAGGRAAGALLEL